MSSKVWLVTGASQGFGLIAVQQLLAAGQRVAATTRKKDDLVKEVGKASDNFLPLEVDITDEGEVKDAIAKTVETFGAIDVVMNNAGYGQLGTIEELSDKEVRANYEVNIFGLMHVIRHTMPYFRKQQSGHFFNISSIAGFTAGFPGWGVYCGTKFALTGLSESLAAEVKEFGVKVTTVYPGYFRTNFLSSGSLGLPKHTIDAYTSTRQMQEQHVNDIPGNQPNDPEKGIAAIIKVYESNEAPLHLFLGKDSYDLAQAEIKSVQADLEKWKDLTMSTAF